jgi:hypothetical protein
MQVLELSIADIIGTSMIRNLTIVSGNVRVSTSHYGSQVTQCNQNEKKQPKAEKSHKQEKLG